MKNDEAKEPTREESVIQMRRRQEQEIEEHKKIMEEMAETWKKRRNEPASPTSMRNSFGFLNIHTGLLRSGFLAFFWLAMAVVIIWQVIINTTESKVWVWAIPLAVVILGGITFLVFLLVRDHIKDIRMGQTKAVGRVRRKWDKKEGGSSYGPGTTYSYVTITYYIAVNGETFEVSKKVYDWLRPDEEVCITYWPHTNTVSRVDKIAMLASTEVVRCPACGKAFTNRGYRIHVSTCPRLDKESAKRIRDLLDQRSP